MVIINSDKVFNAYEGIQEEEKVPDGKRYCESILDLENKFDNSGRKQGAKFSFEQRMRTSGY